MSDTVAQALMWLATFGLGIAGIGLVSWLKSKSNGVKESAQVSKTLKRLDKR